MLKRKLPLLLTLLMGVVILFASCSKDDDPVPTPEPTPVPAKPLTYTVMFYGCGGGNLDDCLDFNLNQLEGYGKVSRVNFTGLIKYSKPYQQNEATQGTRLLTQTDDGLKSEQVHDANYRLDNPAHLTEFINEAKANMPADKYILILWNHGQEFGLSDKAVQDSYPEGTRAVLFDDNTGTSMSTFEIEKGIKDAGAKLDLVYLDLCNMGMAEVYYQLKDCTKYVMAAANPTPGFGGNYTELFNALQTTDSLEAAIKEYVPKCVRNWKNSDCKTADLECYDVTYMDEYASYFKNVTDILKGYAQEANTQRKENQKEYGFPLLPDWYASVVGEVTDGNIFDGYNISVDLCSAVIRIAAERLDGKLSNMATLLRNTLSKMTVAQSSIGSPEWMDLVSMGVLWPTSNFDKVRDLPMMSYCLDNAGFYQATGWGEFLKSVEILSAQKVKMPFRTYYVEATSDVPQQQYNWLTSIEYDEESLPDDKKADVRSEVENIQLIFALYQASTTCQLRYGILFHRDALSIASRFAVSSLFKNTGIKQYNLVTRLVGNVDEADTDKDKFKTEFVTTVEVD